MLHLGMLAIWSGGQELGLHMNRYLIETYKKDIFFS